MRLFRVSALATAGLLAAAACAFADGAFEPNDNALEAAGPLTGAKIAAELEAPHYIDWYRFYARPRRRIAVLGTLTSACTASGSVRVEVFDGDGGLDPSVGHATLENDVLAGRVSFTSIAGHRYLVRVTQSQCPDATYTLQVTPKRNLRVTLGDTRDCSRSKARRKREHRKYVRLRARWRRAHGARRTALHRDLVLQKEQVIVAGSRVTADCLRRPLVGDPFT